MYRAPSTPLSPVPPCTIHPRPFHDSIEKQSAHVSSYLDRTVPARQRRQSYSMRPVGKNGPCCVLRDYHPPKRAFVAGYGERGSCAISAVRMPHTRDPFRRRFEYPAGNNEGPLFRWLSLVLLFIFLSAIKHCTGGAISICPPPKDAHVASSRLLLAIFCFFLVRDGDALPGGSRILSGRQEWVVFENGKRSLKWRSRMFVQDRDFNPYAEVWVDLI